MSASVTSRCGCGWHLDGVLFVFGRPLLLVGRFESCMEGPPRVGFCLTYRGAHRAIRAAIKDMPGHCIPPGE